MNQILQLEINGIHFTVLLEQNETALSFVQQLPLEITMNELNGNEKYVYLDNSLPTDPKRLRFIEAGDIMLYGSDCLVIFYKSFHTPYAYTRIGHIENPSSLKKIIGFNNVIVKITK